MLMACKFSTRIKKSGLSRGRFRKVKVLQKLFIPKRTTKNLNNNMPRKLVAKSFKYPSSTNKDLKIPIRQSGCEQRIVLPNEFTTSIVESCTNSVDSNINTENNPKTEKGKRQYLIIFAVIWVSTAQNIKIPSGISEYMYLKPYEEAVDCQRLTIAILKK